MRSCPECFESNRGSSRWGGVLGGPSGSPSPWPVISPGGTTPRSPPDATTIPHPPTPTTPTGLFAGMCGPRLAEPSSSFVRSVRLASVSSGR